MSAVETPPEDHRPKVLLLKPLALPQIEDECSRHFHLLKAYESPLSTDLYLSSTPASSATVLLCSASTNVSADVLRLLPSLSLIITTSVGLNQLDLPECRLRGIAVASPGSIFSNDVADLAVGLLIDVLRRISASDRFVRRGAWEVNGDYPLGKTLRGKRIGIIGLGRIGARVAKRLEAFGCSISYNARNEKLSVSYPYHPNVCELATDCDVLIICCALTDQTKHLVNKQVLSSLGEEGIVINVGRGAIIDEKDLVSCLLKGKIAGAGLDVFENEPDVPEELFALDNVVLSSHSAVCTSESMQCLEKLIVDNLTAFFSNRPLISVVNYD